MSIKKPEDAELSQLITDVMNVDGIAEAESLTGRSVDLDAATQKLGLGLHLSATALKRKLQVETHDFLHSEEWERRQAILTYNQFRQMYVEEYPYENQKARMEIWLEQPHGLVFVQNIYTRENGKEWNLDHGRVNFAYLPHGKDRHQGLMGLHASGGWESVKHPDWRSMPSPDPKKMFFTPDDLYFRGYFEGDGIIHKLRNLLVHGEYINPWPEWEPGQYPLATWFTTPGDYKLMEQHSLKGTESLSATSKRNIQRYESFPEEIQRVINVKPTWRRK